MRTHLRIVAGELRGRKVGYTINPQLRPTPQMVREALFSILGDAVPGRIFYDVFAGTGVNGLEAISRGAKQAVFVERDARLGVEIDKHLNAWGVRKAGRVMRADVYRWGVHWLAPNEPANLFLSPPFADLEERREDMLKLVADLQQKAALGSVVVVQLEGEEFQKLLPLPEQWEDRKYGRNHLLIWVKDQESGVRSQESGIKTPTSDS